MNMSQRRRRRRGRRGRLPKPVKLEEVPRMEKFLPIPQRSEDPIYIEPAEIEVLRLVDLDGLSQEEAGERMEISRGTIWRLLQKARKKTVQALTEARPLIVYE